ncbi:MAG: hypothetical protein AWM53_01702 [Candidatus Dichloromethanomonas elyunquensis]|nr:MAG: hypothetical protein AWM53_01702 [Candidatus Dichloromethanomonas elyunquensis]
MSEMFKRSFFGYDLESVQQEIDRINQQYELKAKGLKMEMTELNHQKELLRVEYNNVKQEVDFRENKKEFIKNQLFEKYIDLSDKHLAAKHKMEDSIAILKNQVQIKQEELSKYKGYSNKIRTDILKIKDIFETLLEEEGVEK